MQTNANGLWCNFNAALNCIYHFLAALLLADVQRETHHIKEHNDAEVDADRRARGRHLRVVPDESPPEGSKGADGDHTVNDDAEHGSDHHQDLWSIILLTQHCFKSTTIKLKWAA